MARSLNGLRLAIRSDLRRVGGDEHDLDAKLLRELARDIRPRRAVAQVHIDKGKGTAGRCFDGGAAIRSDSSHLIASIDQNALQIEGHEDFVFHDQGGLAHVKFPSLCGSTLLIQIKFH